jgi:hypothetical protein
MAGSKQKQVAVRLDRPTCDRIADLRAVLSTDWLEVSREEVLRALIRAGLEVVEQRGNGLGYTHDQWVQRLQADAATRTLSALTSDEIEHEKHATSVLPS